ncbi:MAG: zinc-ribbon domain-containing protein [Kofleriaceae bacterium]
MRCASCGTDNEADSRFCGGCGARLQPSIRVEPTRKMSNDQVFARAETPVSHVTPAIQPAEMATVRQPAPPRRAVSPVPPAPGPTLPPVAASMSMPVAPPRRWGLIVVVLIIDLGLAIAGGVMLKQGLSDESTTPPAGASPTGSVPTSKRTAVPIAPTVIDTAMANSAPVPADAPSTMAPAPAAVITPRPEPSPPPPQPMDDFRNTAVKSKPSAPARKRATKHRATTQPDRNASPIDPYGATNDD